MVSDIANATFNANKNDTDDAAAVTGFAIVKPVCVKAGVVVATAVDTLIAVAPILAVLAKVNASVRVLLLAVWPTALVVTPVATVTVHSVPAGSVAVAAVNVNVAVAAPVLAAATAKVVLPHPLVVGVERDEKANVGRTIAILSLTRRFAFNEKATDMAVGLETTGLEIDRTLPITVGLLTAGDSIIAVVGTSVASAKTAAIVRVFVLALCGVDPVTTPVAIVTVHCLPVASVAVAAVKIIVAIAVPDRSTAAANDVVSHPRVVGVDGLLSTQLGSTTLSLSCGVRGAFNANVTDSAVLAKTRGYEKSSALYKKAASLSA
jgi:hypothetical protein